MAKVAVRVEREHPLINDAQIGELIVALRRVGYDCETTPSIKRLRFIFQRLNAEKYEELMAVIPNERRAGPVGGPLTDRQVRQIACAVNVWGAEHFAQLLSLVPKLVPARWGIGLARQVTSVGIKDWRSSYCPQSEARSL